MNNGIHIQFKQRRGTLKTDYPRKHKASHFRKAFCFRIQLNEFI